jgi:hypothetical protein
MDILILRRDLYLTCQPLPSNLSQGTQDHFKLLLWDDTGFMEHNIVSGGVVEVILEYPQILGYACMKFGSAVIEVLGNSTSE